MEASFRIYQEGENLVFVLFPTDGGDAILRKAWSLNAIDLKSVHIPDRRSNPTGEHKVSHRKSLVRGGFKLKINYETGRIRVVPLTRQRNELKDRAVIYRFEDIGVEDNREEPIEWQLSQNELRASLDRLPISDE